MGQPQRSRRKVTVISDDEDDVALPSEPAEDERAVEPRKQATGKLKATKKTSRVQQPMPPPSTRNASSQKSPAKARTNKAKGKAAAKEQPAVVGRTIFSFFNTVTQRQASSQPSASPQKLITSQEEPETIHDDSADDEGSNLRLAKGSSTALAVRKRKVQHGESFENDIGLPPPASQKFRKTSGGERVPSFSIVNEDKRPWTEQFAPKDLSELAVHKRKIADVRQWLAMAFNGRKQKVLVLKGAAGTGKTTTIRMLAQDIGSKTMEWKNPAGADLTSEGSASTAAQFNDFVGRAGRSGGLSFAVNDDGGKYPHTSDRNDDQLSEAQKQLLLIEEFPNTFSRSSSTLQSFRSALLQFLASPALPDETRSTPIVLVISETLLSTNTALADSFTAHRLLGPELVNHPYLDTIEFNAVAPTILTKALETIVLKEARKSGRRKTPGPQVLKHLADSGDIRSAVSSLEFLCLRGDEGDVWSSKVTFTKPKKAKTETPLTQSEHEALKLISNRESTLGIFHAVGKVVYNKRIASRSIPQPPIWLPQHHRDKVSENDVDGLIDEMGTDASTFVAALHENYALSCNSRSTEDTLHSLLGCIDSISDSDLLSVDRFSFGTRAFSGSATDSLRQDEMAFQLAARGLLFSLPHPVHRITPNDGKRADAHRMFYPSSIKLFRKREEIEGVLDLLTARFQAGNSLGTLTDRNRGEESGLGGVASWKRSSNLDAGSSDKLGLSEVGSPSTGGAKKEMLMERLPYMSQIIGAKSKQSSVLEQITAVTRLRATVSAEEDEAAEDDEDGDVGLEQWTTDRPDAEAAVETKKASIKSKHSTKATEGGGLAIPVETRVEKLVLEDDDIED